jgi:hypothetical protein
MKAGVGAITSLQVAVRYLTQCLALGDLVKVLDLGSIMIVQCIVLLNVLQLWENLMPALIPASLVSH